jgi:hypothetical protein
MPKMLLTLLAVALCGCSASKPNGEGGNGGGSAAGSGGGVSGSGGGTGGPTGSYAEFCRQNITRSCARQVRCGAYETQRGCEEVFGPFLDVSCNTAPTVFGQAMFDGVAAQRCATATDSDQSCSTNAMLAECEGVFRPTVARGGNCTAAAECQEADYCSAQPQMCPGQCLARTAIGAKIAAGGECVKGAFAQEDGTCVAQVATGSACPANFQGDQAPCAQRTDRCTSGTCTAVTTSGTLGASCEVFAGNSCAIGYDCIDRRCAARIGLGKPCEAKVGAAQCKADLACVNGVCSEKLAEGAGCSFQNLTACKPGLYCNVSFSLDGGMPAGVCSKFRQVGETCGLAGEGQCEALTAYCDDANGKCATRKKAGEACATALECGASLGCEMGKCAAQVCLP